MTHTAILHNAAQGHTALAQLWAWCKPRLVAGHKLTLTVAEATRSTDQNALLHATITDIAKRREWCGKLWPMEVWKRLLVAAWCRANGESVEVVPALDGHGVDIVYRRTSKLTKAECASLIEFIHAWDAMT